MNESETIDKLVSDNIYLAYHFLNKNDFLDKSEVLSGAMNGLYEAARLYDEKKQIKFGTFASMHIAWKMKSIKRQFYSLRRGYGYKRVSLNTKIGEDGDVTLAEIIKDENAVNPSEAMDASDRSKAVDKYIGLLNNRQKGVICSYFGIGRESATLEEIAKKYKISLERVRFIKNQSLEVIRRKNGIKI
jgi:RNA polymerase sigma factor (sigma-70 family)